jgi:long-chain fatty acid transport protein
MNLFGKISTITFLFSFTASVYAAGFQINEISPGLQGDATAGAAAANNDVSSMFFNPATLATLKRPQLYAGGSEILPHVSMSDASAIHTVNIPGDPPSNISATVLGDNSQNNVSPSAFVPAVYFGWPFMNGLTAGLAVIAPYGLKTHYNNDSVLRFAADYSSIMTVDINPALAWAINREWAVGVGFQAQYMYADLSNYNGPYTGITILDELIATTQPTLLHAHGWGYGYTLGALYKPNECTRLGLGFRSQVSEQLRGDGQQYTVPGGTVPAPSPDFPFNAETSVKGAIKTPAVLTLSGAYDYKLWTFKASAQLNLWHTFNQISIYMPDAYATNSTVYTKWRNAWFGALGAEYHYTPCWSFRGGLAYDQTPTTSYRDPRIPDNDRIWANIGLSYTLNDTWSFDAAYSHIFIQEQTVNVTQASGTTATATLPLEVNQVYAKYTGSADVIGVAVRINL